MNSSKKAWRYAYEFIATTWEKFELFFSFFLETAATGVHIFPPGPGRLGAEHRQRHWGPWAWVHNQTRDQWMIRPLKSALSVTWSVYYSHVISMIRHVICAWSGTWSVHDQARDQCMIRHVISAWSVTLSVFNQPRDQCMVASWRVYGHVISAW